MRHLFLIVGALLFFVSCYNTKKVNTSYARNRNICKELKGKALVYMVFVDTKNNDVWTDFDISTAFQSAGEAADWIMANAKKNNVQLDLEIKYFQSNKMRTVKQDLPSKTVNASLHFPTVGIGAYRLNRWADKAAVAVGKKLKFPGEVGNSIIKIPKDNVELISKLRDIYRMDNVALIYLINNNYTNDISVALNTVSDKKIEFGIASYKSPQVLSQLILELFGAANLKENVYSRKRVQGPGTIWPKEIMLNVKDTLSTLEIGPVTQYLIGWKDKLDTSYTKFVH